MLWLLSCVDVHYCFEITGLRNPIDTLYHVQPIMTFSLMPLAFIIEGMYVSVR